MLDIKGAFTLRTTSYVVVRRRTSLRIWRRTPLKASSYTDTKRQLNVYC